MSKVAYIELDKSLIQNVALTGDAMEK